MKQKISLQDAKTVKPRIDGYSYIKLVGDAKAFLEAAVLIEKRISDLGVRHSNQSPIGGSRGWKSHDVWESLKTASHFNFGIALELRLKCILELSGERKQPGKTGHSLEKIYSLIPPEIRRELEELFIQEIENVPIRFEAFIRSKAEPAKLPPRRDLNNLRDFCIYFDRDIKLWMKRYSWEYLSNRTWVQYIEDLSPLMNFVEKAEKIGERMARKSEIVK